MTRVALLAAMSALALPAYSATTALIEPLQYVFRAGKYSRPARLGTLTVKDLRYASTAENVGGLLELATLENRIDPVEMMQFARAYRTTTNGDVLLLTCLRNAMCRPDVYLQIVSTSPLHAEIVRRAPSMDLVHVNQAIGSMTERLMHRYFESSGWIRLEGQVGRAGLDGLYVKRRGDVVEDVLLAECKYNSSGLGSTSVGTQMSHVWVQQKLLALQQYYPDEVTYQAINRLVETGSYRARLWNLKVDGEAVQVTVSKIRSKGAEVNMAPLVPSELDDLPTSAINTFRFDAPRTAFEDVFLRAYRQELDAIGPLEL